MGLYDIAQSLANLDFMDMETGEVDMQQLQDLNMKFDEKADNIACYIKNLLSEAKAIKAERDALQERQKAKENKAEALKNYLDNMLRLANKSKFESARVKVTYRASTAIEIQEADFIKWAEENGRTELLAYKPPTASKTAISEALKSEAVPFVDVVERQNIQIK